MLPDIQCPVFSYISSHILPGWVQSAQTDSMGQTAGRLSRCLTLAARGFVTSTSTGLLPHHLTLANTWCPSLVSCQWHREYGGERKHSGLGRPAFSLLELSPPALAPVPQAGLCPRILCLVIYWRPEQGGHCVQLPVPPCSSPCHLPGLQWFSCSLVSGPRGASLFCLTWPT